MLYENYQFLCRLTDEAMLPCYKGSTFRGGVFGRALKRVVCALKRQECDQCLLKKRCVYAMVFETQDTMDTPECSRIAAAPHPFVIEPPLTMETRFSEGSSFDFRLLLFGEANRNLPYFIYAFEQMGKIGIGKRVNGKRGHFSLEQVKAGEKPIYSSADQTLKTENPPILSLKDNGEFQKRTFRLRLSMITPLRLKFENRLKADLPFHVLVRAMLRRMSSLYNFYGEGEPSLDYRGLVKKAMDVKIVDEDLNWFDWRRYSFRQDKAMLMGGMVGSVTYEGDMGEYMPLIEFCSKVHLGKQTSFGPGKIQAEIVE